MKRLKGVAHDLLHHAISGLCGIVPYIYRAGASKARYNIEVPIYPFAHPTGLPHNVHLDLGLEGLRIFFPNCLRSMTLYIKMLHLHTFILSS
jgi:hypothetical protein